MNQFIYLLKGIIFSTPANFYDRFYAVPFAVAINTYYGRPNIPIGAFDLKPVIPASTLFFQSFVTTFV